jgi:gas vesicle protein
MDYASMDWTDYEQLKAKAKQLGRPVEMLIALSYNNDPFVMTGERKRRAEWLANIWDRLDINGSVHVRRIHYVIVSYGDIAWIKGGNYENTEAHWRELTWAVRDARYLGSIPDDNFNDRRNDEPILYLTNSAEDAQLTVVRGELSDDALEAPSAPELHFEPPVIDQRYHIELWAEKTTVNDVLLPIAERYGVNLITGAGDLSLTRCKEFIQRVKDSGRPARVLYISDFDPSGENMPVAVARKIEFEIRRENLDLDVQVRSILLTKEQCEQYELPRVPIKESDKRSDRWSARHGDGATELDALEALHPGMMREIIEAEIERYYDHDIDEAVEDAASGVREMVEQVNDEVREEFAEQLETLESEWSDIAEQIDDWKRRAESTYRSMDAELRDRAPSIHVVDWPEPDMGDEDVDPLYDSGRDYVEQMDRYKLHQGKPTEGLSRGGRQRRENRQRSVAA